jgi:anti-anti-sigma regulatory factor
MTDENPIFQSENLGDVTIVTLLPSDFFDQQTIAAARRELTAFWKAENPAKMVLRFTNVQRFSSDFVRVLVILREHLRANHPAGELKLCELQAQLRVVFKVFDPQQKLFKLYDTVKDAYAAFQS